MLRIVLMPALRHRRIRSDSDIVIRSPQPLFGEPLRLLPAQQCTAGRASVGSALRFGQPAIGAADVRRIVAAIEARRQVA